MKKSAKLEWDYIAFSDQDDVWDTDKLYIAVQSLKPVNRGIPALYYCG